ncbi:S8 family peptidase [Selenihalanaerobacter shriftii]|uniref:Serine protease, subtilisin family n=1 Tax=Selenihalanaerobacter shriftii TaxID=142842 RepID=A0A1T4QSS6_9FIRM|nr:S8 family peptidase [Selenihalanaerobacter shriftii]SKA06833.1 Serine protease, subtilisin family [Selenihalanaerobacter shriftii]
MNLNILLKLLLTTNLLSQLEISQFKEYPQAKNLTQYIIITDKEFNKKEFKSQIEQNGGKLVKKLSLVNGFVYQFKNIEDKTMIQSVSGIKRIEKDTFLQVNSKNDMKSWGLKAIDALNAWAHFREVRVGIIDTGVDLNHYDLTPVHNGLNTINHKTLPYDSHGHGTHISGIIGGRKNGKGILGILPDVEIYPIKAFNRNGEGRLSSVIEGIEWSIKNNIKILNMSFGTTEDNSSLKKAVKKAYKSGITMVAASGNKGRKTIDYPAKYPEVIAVAAINERKKIANFNNYGEGLDLLAPGVNIKSTWRNNRFRTLNGTSMATAHVTGAIALLISIFKDLNPKQTKELLIKGASSIPSVPKEKQGAGIVNILKTMKLAEKQFMKK